jgi:hypothetical protein
VPGHVGIGQQLLEQADRLGIARAAQEVAMQPLDERGRGRLPVDDIGPHAARVTEEAHGIGRPQRGRLGGIEKEADQPLRALVGEQDIPAAVHHESGVRLLLAQHEVQRPPDLRHLGRVEGPLAIHGGEACGEEQLVAGPRRNFEDARQQQEHLAARLRAARLDEGKMSRRHLGLDGEGELAHALTLAPLAEQPSQRAARAQAIHPQSVPGPRHAGSLHRAVNVGHYLRGN